MLPTAALIIVGGIALLGIMTFLQSLAAALRDQTDVHDLRREVALMQNRYREELLAQEEYTAQEVIGSIGTAVGVPDY
ncbi:MAG: hypothetical protein AAF108_05875 [Planctomycetota bacterium]